MTVSLGRDSDKADDGESPSTFLQKLKTTHIWTIFSKHDIDDYLDDNVFTHQTETALMYDAVQIFATALSELDQSQVKTMTLAHFIVNTYYRV